MNKIDSCKYYGGVMCTKRGIPQCRGCRDYESAYTSTTCKHYNKEKNECKILVDHDIPGPPCSRPKLNKIGKPVKCTFYEFGKCCEVEVNTQDLEKDAR